jgi:hypothetical protein
MKCHKCFNVIVSADKHLKCDECSHIFHLTCLKSNKEFKFTEEDYEFIKSSSSGWKCVSCNSKKRVKDDATPIKPVSSKVIEKSTAKTRTGSETDSDTNSTGVTKKLICIMCNKGFAFNAYKCICISCNSTSHLKCISDFNNSIEEYNKVKSVWQCLTCVQESTKQAVSAPDKALSAGGQMSGPDRALSAGGHSGSADSGDVSLSVIMNEILSFRNEVKRTNADFKESMDKYSEWIVDNGRKIEEAANTIKQLVTDIDVIRQENVNLKKALSELTTKVEFLEQSSKDNTIEIQGIPFEPNENLIELVQKVSSAVNFACDPSMIDKCYRIRPTFGATDKPGSIVVRFVRNVDMQLFVKKRREKRNLNTRDIGFLQGNSSVIYVNNSLTPSKRKLLRAARLCRSEKHYTFVWVSGGRIFLRKNQGDPAIEIKREEDLEKLQ